MGSVNLMLQLYMLVTSVIHTPYSAIVLQSYTVSRVSINRFTGYNIQQLKFPNRLPMADPIFLAGACMKYSWCTTGCILPSDEYVLTNLLVSGGITDPMAGEKIPCYTIRPAVIYPSPNAVVVATRTEPAMSRRLISHVEDGVYGFTNPECYYSDVGITKQFIYIMLPQAEPVRRVVVRAQYSGEIFNKFQKVEVRVGNTPRSGKDFSANTRLGNIYWGPIQKHNVDIIFAGSVPVVGMYVSIQELKSTGVLSVCTIEVLK